MRVGLKLSGLSVHKHTGNTFVQEKSKNKKKKKTDVKLAGCLVWKEVGGKEFGIYNMLAASGYI